MGIHIDNRVRTERKSQGQADPLVCPSCFIVQVTDSTHSTCQEPHERSLESTKTGRKGKDAVSFGAVNASRRSIHGTQANAKTLDENNEITRHATVSHEFRTAPQ